MAVLIDMKGVKGSAGKERIGCDSQSGGRGARHTRRKARYPVIIDFRTNPRTGLLEPPALRANLPCLIHQSCDLKA